MNINERQKEEIERKIFFEEEGKLSALKFKKKFPFNINKGLAGYEISDLSDGKYYQLDFDVYLPTKGKNLQRGFVWTLEQKQELIFSVLKELQIPSIVVIQHELDDTNKNKVFQIIDGKQRLSTLISFYRGEFSIPFEGKDWYFNDLTKHAQRLIDNSLRFDIGYSYHDNPISDDDKIAWFELINFAGTPQDKEHLLKLKS